MELGHKVTGLVVLTAIASQSCRLILLLLLLLQAVLFFLLDLFFFLVAGLTLVFRVFLRQGRPAEARLASELPRFRFHSALVGLSGHSCTLKARE